MRPYGSAKTLEHRRVEALRLHQQGWKAPQIAARLATTPQSVNRWLRASRRGGIKAIRAKPVPGRPDRLSSRQRHTLRQLLVKGAQAAGYHTDLWTCPRIAQVIRHEFRMDYHVNYLPRFLAALGFSCQKPESVAKEKDAAAVRQWIARDWHRIKKTPHAAELTSFSSTKQAF